MASQIHPPLYPLLKKPTLWRHRMSNISNDFKFILYISYCIFSLFNYEYYRSSAQLLQCCFGLYTNSLVAISIYTLYSWRTRFPSIIWVYLWSYIRKIWIWWELYEASGWSLFSPCHFFVGIKYRCVEFAWRRRRFAVQSLSWYVVRLVRVLLNKDMVCWLWWVELECIMITNKEWYEWIWLLLSLSSMTNYCDIMYPTHHINSNIFIFNSAMIGYGTIMCEFARPCVFADGNGLLLVRGVRVVPLLFCVTKRLKHVR